MGARRSLTAFAVWLAALLALYGTILINLARQWQSDESYSHGWLVPPIAALLAWQQRDRLRAAQPRPSLAGLLLIFASLALFVAGSLAAELFTTRLSFVGVLAGTVLYVLGSTHFRILLFPLAFLVFMVPLPAIIFDRMTQSLQLVASRLGEELLRTADIAVLRDGNVLALSSITLQVTDACSGIRSLMSLLTVSSLVAYLFEPTLGRRATLTLMAIPVAIVLNGLRIAWTGVAVAWFGPHMARGFAHEASGWAIFIAAFGLIWVVHWAMRVVAGPARAPIGGRPDAPGLAGAV